MTDRLELKETKKNQSVANLKIAATPFLLGDVGQNGTCFLSSFVTTESDLLLNPAKKKYDGNFLAVMCKAEKNRTEVENRTAFD